jgi:hypothetical protein
MAFSSGRAYCVFYRFRMPVDYRQEHARRSVRLVTALFPVPQDGL